MNRKKLLVSLLLGTGMLCSSLLFSIDCRAQDQQTFSKNLAGPPPVRIAVVAGGGSGMEQDVVDRISSELQNNPSCTVSTVNPDWFVQCNIMDKTDTVGGSVRVNGTVVIKTTAGHVLNTVSIQTNKQDFSLTPGMPVNKALQDRGAREVIGSLVDRARQPLADAIGLEMEVRQKLLTAQNLGDEDRYDEGLQILMAIPADSPHFQPARKMIAKFNMEKDAMEFVQQAKDLAKEGQYTKAIQVLKAVDLKSKRFPVAKALAAKYRAALARRTPRRSPVAASGGANASAQLKALDAQKKALDAQRKAVEAQEAAIKSKK